MSSERWQRLEEIFADARQRPVATRADFVAGTCGADEMLRNEVLRLLTADDASSAFMSGPALDQLAQTVAREGWRLRPGDIIGVYTILRRLGSGGAGEVWRARDERLSRDVAIKILLPHFSSDRERLGRFAIEARTASALNHSNILTVYDVGEHEGVPFLVSECLEGQSVRQRLDAGPVSVGKAVSVALGIARGLAAAHVRGIVHRDLKPENAFIRSDGVVKILDFGLATLQSPVDAHESDGRPNVTGIIAGTAGYMAPEQVKGERVDSRTDLFALGVVLYELLTGRHPFRRSSTFETLHAVLTVDPPDPSTVNELIPAQLARIVMRLVEKAPDARFQSALDLVWALEQTIKSAPPLSVAASKHGDASSWWRSRQAAWVLGPTLTALALLGGLWLLPGTPVGRGASQVRHFTLPLPEGVALNSAPIISPDSQHIAFAGGNANGGQLFVHTLNSREARPVPGTEGARQPFWSPDSKTIGFFAGGGLMTAAWPGGAPVKVADAPFPLGGAWNRSGVILFGPDVILTGLHRVSAGGEQAQPATLLDLARGDNAHSWPVFLPDGIHFLYNVRSTNDERRGVYLGRIDRPASSADSLLFRSESDVAYVPLPGGNDGALLYVANGRIEVRRFDQTRLTISSDARAIGLFAGGTTLTQPAMLSASSEMLVFANGVVPYGNRLESVTRDGERLRLWDQPEPQNWPRVSPDGRFLARQRVDLLANNPDIWVEDLERGPRVRVTTAVEPDIQAVWSPDGQRLAYVTGAIPRRPGKRIVSIAASDGTGVIRSFPCPRDYCEPTDWVPQQSRLLLNVRDARGSDVWMMSTETGSAEPLLSGVFDERDARIAPKGRWIAYVSRESGRPEISVRSISGPPMRIGVSAEGGDQPVWRRDGRELFFVDLEGHLRSVSVRWTGQGTPEFAAPTRLKVPRVGFGHWGTQYDFSPDGSRMYFLPRNDDAAPREIHVVIGWRGLLE